MKTFGSCSDCRFKLESADHDPACFRSPPTLIAANGGLYSVWPLVNGAAGCFEHEPVQTDEDQPPAKEATKTDHLAPLSDKQAVIIAAFTGHHNLCDKDQLLAYAVDKLKLADSYHLTTSKLASMAASLRQVAKQDLLSILPESISKKEQPDG